MVFLGTLYPSELCTLLLKIMHISCVRPQNPTQQFLCVGTVVRRIATIRSIPNMSHHPSGVEVELVGIEEGGRGRSCEEHDVCGKVLCIDVVARLRSIQIQNGKWSLPLCCCCWFQTSATYPFLIFFLSRFRRRGGGNCSILGN